MAVDFTKAVIESVAVSVLLTRDFVPRSKPPKVSYQVQMELPRVLEVALRAPGAPMHLVQETLPPKRSFDAFVKAVKALPQSERIFADMAARVQRQGHVDPVLGAIGYHRKPPTADIDTIADVQDQVAKCLLSKNHAVDIAGDLDVGLAYDNAHRGLLLTV